MQHNNLEMITPATFTAVDFETAQGKSYSICQVGIVRVENGKVVHTFECLVQPPNNFYWNWFTDEIHGISPEMTVDAPTFDIVWHKIQPYITGQNVVAHNIYFDARCLKETLEYYGLPVPEYTKHCTMKIFGGGLADNCKDYGIELNHHDALSDATACAKLFILHLEKGAPNNPHFKILI
jgi:DNA polymerase III subunit epsilon